MKRIPFFCSLLSVFCSGVLWAAGEFDAFALPGVGARPAGMGNAFVGLADDVETIYYNAGGLGQLKTNNAIAMYQLPSLQTSRSFLAINHPWKNDRFPGSVALGWLRLRSSDIEITNSSEQILGTDALTNDLVMLGAGTQLFEHYSIGLVVKYLRFGFHGFTEDGFGVDAGFHGSYDWFQFGLNWSDLNGTTVHGTSLGAGGEKVTDRVPSRLRPGVAFLWREPFDVPVKVNVLADGLFRLEGPADARGYMGVEVWGYEDHVAVRTGFEQAQGPTFGTGLRWGLLQVDYAYVMSLALYDEHRISTSFHF